MFYHTIREYKPVRFKGYDIFLELKANNMLMASCVHDDDRLSFNHKFMDYTKKEVVSLLKANIKDRIRQLKEGKI
jgi:hypothetical protein|tara:strand:+ start:49 stop:273 length:225 start_codon:yes stop_codon:yes gene_type:complete